MPRLSINSLPGTRDLLPENLAGWQVVEKVARQVFDQYGFLEIRTPIIEPTELFSRGVGEETDIVGKEMYTFLDKGDRSVTLRPEATASVVRAYLQNSMRGSGGLTKLFYLGPMFRYERHQAGRYRQFYQIGAEALGSDHPAVDAEMIEMALGILEKLRLKFRLLLNSVGCRQCRPGYTSLLREALGVQKESLCEDCRRRSEKNSLRVFDCKKEHCQQIIRDLPVITQHLCTECSDHFQSVQGFLTEAQIGYELEPRLVRGLDYYVRTAFEIVSDELGSQDALVGGGRYDGLSEAIGGPPVSAIGFAAGLDRLTMVLPEEMAHSGVWKPEVYLAYSGEPAFRKAIELARHLRLRQHICSLDFGATSFKSQLRQANRCSAEHVLLIGDEELKEGRFTLKRMKDSTQWKVTLEELDQVLGTHAPGRENGTDHE